MIQVTGKAGTRTHALTTGQWLTVISLYAAAHMVIFVCRQQCLSLRSQILPQDALYITFFLNIKKLQLPTEAHILGGICYKIFGKEEKIIKNIFVIIKTKTNMDICKRTMRDITRINSLYRFIPTAIFQRNSMVK